MSQLAVADPDATKAILLTAAGVAVYLSNKFEPVFARIFGEYEYGNLSQYLPNMSTNLKIHSRIRRIRIRIKFTA
jgi:hypothetical protein